MNKINIESNIQMSKSMLSKFKKSLEESSNIIYDSRASHQSRREMHLIQSHEITAKREKEQVQRSSFNSNCQDSNKLIKMIPQLISENDQLKQKVQNLQKQLGQIIYQRKNYHESRISNQEQSARQNIKRRITRLQNFSIDRPQKYSLDHFRTSMAYKMAKRQSISNDVQALSDKIAQLESQVRSLKKANRLLAQQNTKMNQLRQYHSKQIDKIVLKFDETLCQKEQLFKKALSHYQNKIQDIKRQEKAILQEKEALKLQLLKVKEEIHKYHKQDNKIHRVVETNRSISAYNSNAIIQHLWKVKDVQLNNIVNILHSFNNI